MFEIVFVTSSKDKLANARHIFRDYQIIVSGQKHYGIGYSEPRIYNRIELLQKSIDDATSRWIKNVSNPHSKLFFIEDTSVIIRSLSSQEERPGVDIKYWMRGKDFNAVDKIINDAGGDRFVTVRSDVILNLPSDISSMLDKKYMHFTGTVDGYITENEFNVKTSALYPWLNDKTFNKWFIPIGCDKPLSLLPIRLADEYDFRARSFAHMIEFLVKYVGLRKKDSSRHHRLRQASFPFASPVFLICGPTCAGKTTLANFLAHKFNYYHIEASDFMYLSYYENHGVDSGISIGEYAFQALKSDHCIVVDRIINYINELNNRLPIVVTGFRSPLEIDAFFEKYNGSLPLEEIFIDADVNTRFNRHKDRGRYTSDYSRESFDMINNQQDNMGISKIRTRLNHFSIYNNESLDSLYSIFTEQYKNILPLLENIDNKKNYTESPITKLEDQILVSLLDFIDRGEYFTTAKIASLINDKFYYSKSIKSKNNVSRYFNQNFHPFYEIKREENKNMFRLSQTGISRARSIKSY